MGVFKASLRKSPLAPDVDLELLSQATEGFSGADIGGVCSAAAKIAIRGAIAAERRQFEEKDQRRRAAEEKGEEYDPTADVFEDVVPYITMDMLQSALKGARRSVSKADLQRYLQYKVEMERRLGMDEQPNVNIVGLHPEQPNNPSSASSGAPSRFSDDSANDDDSIYG